MSLFTTSAPRIDPAEARDLERLAQSGGQHSNKKFSFKEISAEADAYLRFLTWCGNHDHPIAEAEGYQALCDDLEEVSSAKDFSELTEDGSWCCTNVIYSLLD